MQFHRMIVWIVFAIELGSVLSDEVLSWKEEQDEVYVCHGSSVILRWSLSHGSVDACIWNTTILSEQTVPMKLWWEDGGLCVVGSIRHEVEPLHFHKSGKNLHDLHGPGGSNTPSCSSASTPCRSHVARSLSRDRKRPSRGTYTTRVASRRNDEGSLGVVATERAPVCFASRRALLTVDPDRILHLPWSSPTRILVYRDTVILRARSRKKRKRLKGSRPSNEVASRSVDALEDAGAAFVVRQGAKERWITSGSVILHSRRLHRCPSDL
ncbi:unnamed protein product [Darwinula stevensoni]|uniref:Uncharacterized protein n=1 Tax=Darwinula stevensoni TaxID=69355 RepID=A0A7R8ZZM5_9CRUS|nr:unnamed protein product [Darwinula stevensoni]CAG0884003.1 unnamed protein product [Darwinula stevensoni]